jgi:hypothetical protein
MNPRHALHHTALCLLLVGLLVPTLSTAAAKSDDFDEVVSLIEHFYHVKHTSLPFLARVGIKTAAKAATLSHRKVSRLVEGGSAKLAFFEDQDFKADGPPVEFRVALGRILGPEWSPLVQTMALKDAEQTYIYTQESGDKLNLLVVTLEANEGVVIQAIIKPEVLFELLQNPEELENAISNDVNVDQE